MKRLSLYIYLLFTFAFTTLQSCKNSNIHYDASGVLEATEVVISAQANGEIKFFNIEEGDNITAYTVVGYIDTTQLHLQKRLLMVGQKATQSQRPNISKQIAATSAALDHAKQEEQRLERLKQADAATSQQLDDIKSKVKQLQAQLNAQVSTMEKNISGIDAESSAKDIQIAQINDLIDKSLIKIPFNGTVLQKYAQAGEQTAQGKPLMKIADLNKMTLRAYVSANQLSKIKLGQKALVYVLTNNEYQAYDGVVSSIANQAEFTPKTIQTQEERLNLVYAVKISVANKDKMLKNGMYADVAF